MFGDIVGNEPQTGAAPGPTPSPSASGVMSCRRVPSSAWLRSSESGESGGITFTAIKRRAPSAERRAPSAEAMTASGHLRRHPTA